MTAAYATQFWQRQTNVWRKATTPARGPKRLINGEAIPAARRNCVHRQRQDPLRVSAAVSPRNREESRMWTIVRTSIFALAAACCASACTQEQLAGCVIKGNISSSGERIYHVPGQRYYDKTVISWSKGERWFCTEQEAVAAGWRKAKV